MSDWITFGVLVGATYAISKALGLGTPPAKPPKKITRSTPRQTHAPTVPHIPTTRTEWPTRVPVDTAKYRQNATVEPSLEPQHGIAAPQGGSRPTQRKPRVHRGSGPFGANQQILKAAQKSAFKWHVGPDEYDEDCGNGWIEGLSEDESGESEQDEYLETHI